MHQKAPFASRASQAWGIDVAVPRRQKIIFIDNNQGARSFSSARDETARIVRKSVHLVLPV